MLLEHQNKSVIFIIAVDTNCTCSGITLHDSAKLQHKSPDILNWKLSLLSNYNRQATKTSIHFSGIRSEWTNERPIWQIQRKQGKIVYHWKNHQSTCDSPITSFYILLCPIMSYPNLWRQIITLILGVLFDLEINTMRSLPGYVPTSR